MEDLLIEEDIEQKKDLPKENYKYLDRTLIGKIHKYSRMLHINNQDLIGQDLIDSINWYNIKESPEEQSENLSQLNAWTAVYYCKIKAKTCGGNNVPNVYKTLKKLKYSKNIL